MELTLTYEELLTQNNHLKELLNAAVYGTIPDGAGLTTMLYAMRARAYNKYISDTMGEAENDGAVF